MQQYGKVYEMFDRCWSLPLSMNMLLNRGIALYYGERPEPGMTTYKPFSFAGRSLP